MVFDKETMKPKGYGFCDFADPETAAAAIKVLGDGEFHGRLLRLRLADSFGGMPGKGVSKGGEPGKKSTVFVGNIPYDAGLLLRKLVRLSIIIIGSYSKELVKEVNLSYHNTASLSW